MKGIEGPLLCMGDLLRDLGEKEDVVLAPDLHNQKETTSVSDSVTTLQSFDLTKLFQENYSYLNEALAGTDHSWTALTLRLCIALETANKLVQSANLNVRLLSEKVGEFEKIVKRGDSAVAAAKVIHVSVPKGRSIE